MSDHTQCPSGCTQQALRYLIREHSVELGEVWLWKRGGGDMGYEKGTED